MRIVSRRHGLYVWIFLQKHMDVGKPLAIVAGFMAGLLSESALEAILVLIS